MYYVCVWRKSCYDSLKRRPVTTGVKLARLGLIKRNFVWSIFRGLLACFPYGKKSSLMRSPFCLCVCVCVCVCVSVCLSDCVSHPSTFEIFDHFIQGLPKRLLWFQIPATREQNQRLWLDSERFWRWCITLVITGFLDSVHHLVF
jgi:hypothetical protein